MFVLETKKQNIILLKTKKTIVTVSFSLLKRAGLENFVVLSFPIIFKEIFLLNIYFNRRFI